jgi:O-antigen ligase
MTLRYLHLPHPGPCAARHRAGLPPAGAAPSGTGAVLFQLVFGLLCLVVFLIPLEELLTISGIMSVPFLISAAALALASVNMLTHPFGAVRLSPVMILAGGFILWCVVSLLWSSDPDNTVSTVFTYLGLFLFVWMIQAYVTNGRQLRRLMQAYLAGCFVPLASLFVDYVVKGSVADLGATRFSGSGLNPNRMALLLAIGILIAVYLIGTGSTKRNLAYWIYIPLATFGGVLTGSRAGSMALAVSLAFALFSLRTNGWKVKLVMFATISLMAALIPTFVSEEILFRLTEGKDAATLSIRQDQWIAGLECWSWQPFTGVGAGSFVAAVTAKGGRDLVAHNTFVQVLVENGLVGAAFMLAIWTILIRKAFTLSRREATLWLSVSVIWTIVSLSSSLEYHKVTWLLYAFILTSATATRPPPPPAVMPANGLSFRRGSRGERLP